MKAMVLKEYGKPLVFSEVNTPEPGYGEVLVKIKACGVCGTDLKISSGTLPGTKIPLIMGHEPAGVIESVGEGVRNLRSGDRVCVHFYVTCGDCEYCRTGRETLCPDLAQLGFHINGGFAEYLVVPEVNCVPIPPNLSFEKAAILGDSVATAYHAVVSRAGIKPTYNVIVMGTGGVGIHVVQMAKVAGANVIAVDTDEKKLEMAQTMGADEVVVFDEKTYPQAIHKLYADGVDAIFETVGQPLTLEMNIKLLKRSGKLVIIGYKPGNSFPVDPLYILNREIQICGSRASSKDELKRVVELSAAERIYPIVTKEVPLNEVNEMMSQLKEGKIFSRAVVKPL